MQQLSPGYFAELANQCAFLSAVLGGFAVTFLGVLLTISSPKRVIGWAIGFAGVAAAAFICAALSATFISVATHPEALERVTAQAMSDGTRATMALTLMLGIYALLVSMGLSGWIRSRRVGIVTTLAALLGVIVTSSSISISG